MKARYCGLMLLAVAAAGQERRHFEVASIKPNQSGRMALQSFAYSPGGGFTALNATLVDVIVRVYPTRRIQMQGGPSWIDSERFDIVAKADRAEGPIQSADWQQMVQTLLEDRFQLKYHVETREMPVLALVPAKSGPTLTVAKEGGEPSLSPGEGGHMIFRYMSITGLVNTMANMLHTPVVDRTGISGYFDFTLDPHRFANPDDTVKESLGDLVVTAVREQLGLRLDKQRASLDITVIDRAERPSEN